MPGGIETVGRNRTNDSNILCKVERIKAKGEKKAKGSE
jgi:hypothetical protein